MNFKLISSKMCINRKLIQKALHVILPVAFAFLNLSCTKEAQVEFFNTHPTLAVIYGIIFLAVVIGLVFAIFSAAVAYTGLAVLFIVTFFLPFKFF